MTAKARATLKSEAETTFADNTAGAISAADLRAEYGHAADSMYNPIDDNSGDTQLMTEAEKTKVGHITVTGAIDLDDVVTKVDTPVANQVGVWTGDGTLEGDANFVWTGSQLQAQYDVSGESFPVRLRNGAAHSASNRVRVRLEMRNSAAEWVEYGRVEARSEDTTDGSEDGAVQIDVIRGGVVEEAAVFNTSAIIMNENGADRDFRVESSNDEEAFFVDGSNGRVGFGTGVPQTRAEFLGLGASNPVAGWFAAVTGISFLDDQAQPALLCAHAGATPDDQPIMFLRRSKGTLAAPTVVANADDVGSLMFSGYDGAAFQNTAEVKGVVDGAASGGTVPMALSFRTGTATGNRAERLRISSAGIVTVGGAAVQVQPSEGGFVNGDKTKLNGIEASADVTDATSVAAAGGVLSNPSGVTGADAVTNIMTLTQSEYDAIGSPNASTLYVITD